VVDAIVPSLPSKLPIQSTSGPTVESEGVMAARGDNAQGLRNLRVFVGWDPVAKQRSYLKRTERGTRPEASTALAALALESDQP
jgi:hypothetical protein